MRKSTLITALVSICPIVTTPPVLAASPASWTGCYAGINAGYVWSKISGTNLADGIYVFQDNDIGSATATGGALGGQLGCDYQLDNWVLGGRAAMDWTNAQGSHAFRDGTSPNNEVDYDLKYFGTLTARFAICYGKTPWAISVVVLPGVGPNTPTPTRPLVVVGHPIPAVANSIAPAGPLVWELSTAFSPI